MSFTSGIHRGAARHVGKVVAARDARIGPGSREGSVSGCGRLLVLPGRARQPIGASGTLLGAFKDVILHERTVPFPPGAALLLYTDGIFEADGPHASFLK